MAEKARTTLQLTVNPGYVRTWGAWEGMRELVQNAADAAEDGHKMVIDYRPMTDGRSKLVIRTEGTTISRETLLLGATSKADDARMRGHFGEGFKLAWLVLLRSGYEVWCKSGGERWVPRIEHSEEFGAELIKVDVAPATFENVVHTEVRGVSEADWQEFKRRMLFLEPPASKDMIKVGYNYLLMGSRVGCLYSKGIYVGRLPGVYTYGYDLGHVELDRDRRLADPWSLKTGIRQVIEDAVEHGDLDSKDVFAMLNGNTEESRIVGDYTYSSTRLGRKLAKDFVEEYGDKAIPVTDTSATIEAQHFGLKGVVVAKGLAQVLEAELGKWEERKQSQALSPSKRYGFLDLSEDEQKVYAWAMAACHEVEPELRATVVDFIGPDVLGTYCAGEICLARKALTKEQAVPVLVHEWCHKYGADGTVEHRDAIDRMFGRIIATFYK